MITVNQNEIVKVQYTNWKGITSKRLIVPVRVFFGENEYHPEPQWLLECTDVEKQATRTFAMKDIHQWGPFKVVE